VAKNLCNPPLAEAKTLQRPTRQRLEVLGSFGLVEIEANVSDMPELDRQLWEIDENLMRVELTELERAEHLARRKDIYVARHPETRAGAAGGHGKHGSATDNLSFAADTASKTGLDERTIQRAVRRSDRIASDVKAAIADIAISDSGIELDALAAAKDVEHATQRGGVHRSEAITRGQSNPIARLDRSSFFG
jgi:hypothetical protein